MFYFAWLQEKSPDISFQNECRQVVNYFTNNQSDAGAKMFGPKQIKFDKVTYYFLYQGIGKKLNDMLPYSLSFAWTILEGSSSFVFRSPLPPKNDESDSDSELSESNTANLSSSLFSIAANSEEEIDRLRRKWMD